MWPQRIYHRFIITPPCENQLQLGVSCVLFRNTLALKNPMTSPNVDKKEPESFTGVSASVISVPKKFQGVFGVGEIIASQNLTDPMKG